MKAILFISHGSRSIKTEGEVRGFIERLRQKAQIAIIEYAFLDVARPTIPEGIDACVTRGATDIVVLLNFLNAGLHVDEDIPEIVEEARAKYPKVTFRITKPVGQHERIMELFLDMVDNPSQE